MTSIVVMGVAGSGKSSLGLDIAQALDQPLIEGDSFHSDANRRKMAQGVALSDADRKDWLVTLAGELQRHRGGAVLTCSALRSSYRQLLRAAAPGLRFVYLRIDQDAAQDRVASRGGSHFFHASLVASQFATLESPEAEPGVLTLDATQTREALLDQATRWLKSTRCQVNHL